MKLHFIKSSLVLAVILSVTATSCLKDKAYDNGVIQSGSGHVSTIKVIGVGLTVSNTSNFLTISLDKSDNDTTINLIPVTLGATEPAQEDIHVTLTANNTLVDDYNTDNGTDYVVPPSTIFSIPNPTVTIPKGQVTGYLQIKFKPNDFLAAPYAVGYTISAIQEAGYTISGNLANGIVAIGVKNQFDGQYQLSITTFGWAAYGISDGVTNIWPSNFSLVTSGANSVTFSAAETGSGQPAFTAGGAITSFGATQPQFIFDPATNLLVDVKNLAPDDGRGRAFHLNPAVTDSRFDPVTRSIYAAYIMVQNGRPDQKIFDTLTYIGPR